MSVVLGAHCGRYVIVAADTRGVLFHHRGRRRRRAEGHSDRVLWATDALEKVAARRGGLVAGGGAWPVVKGVIGRMPSCRTVAEMVSAILEEREAFAATAPHLREHSEYETGVLITYRAGDADGTLRLVAHHQGLPTEQTVALTNCQPGYVLTLMAAPRDGRELEARAVTALLEKGVGDGVALQDGPLGDDIAYHVKLMRRAVAEAARLVPSRISRDSRIGVHTRDDQVWVMNFPPIDGARLPR